MDTVKKEVVVKNKSGLHARPAALFVQIANKFNSAITVIKDGQEVNGKSIMGILMLAAGPGSVIVLSASGGDAAEAILELEKIVGLGDEDELFTPSGKNPADARSSRQKRLGHKKAKND